MGTEFASQDVPNKQKQSQSDEQQIQTLNMILSETTAFIYLFDKQGRYRFASEAGAQLLGLKQSDFLGTTWQELGLPAEFMEPFEVHRRNVMATGQTVIEEILFPVAMGMRSSPSSSPRKILRNVSKQKKPYTDWHPSSSLQAMLFSAKLWKA